MAEVKNLTLQITKDCFQAILKGEQKEETRNIYPYNAKTYVRYLKDDQPYKYFVDCFDGDEDKMAQWLWATTDETTPEDEALYDRIAIDFVEYTQLTLINGRRKDAPRLVVEVLDYDIKEVLTEDGGHQFVEWEDKAHPVQYIVYKLGKVLKTENV